jgi:Fic family protein
MVFESLSQSPVGKLVEINGHDRRFDRSYRHWAFIPDPLPTELVLSAQTVQLIALASSALGRLDQAGRQVPNPALLRRPTLRREAQSTSALEGTFATLTDVLEADLDGSKSTPEVFEVLNYVVAAQHGFSWIAESKGFSLSLLLDLHRLLMRGTKSESSDTGSIRTKQVFIGGRHAPIEESRFVPAPPGDSLVLGIRALLDWMNDATLSIPAVAKAALAHYQFETLHPFDDGNGRIGRLLIVAQFLDEGELHEPLLSVSPWFEARRTEYQDQLRRVSETGDFDQWIRFFAEAIRAQSESTTRKVDRLLKFSEDARNQVRTIGRSGLILQLADLLIEHPVMTPTWLAKRCEVSFPTANSAILKLVSLGLLTETTGGRYGRTFVARKVLQILEDDGI